MLTGSSKGSVKGSFKGCSLGSLIKGRSCRVFQGLGLSSNLQVVRGYQRLELEVLGTL